MAPFSRDVLAQSLQGTGPLGGGRRWAGGLTRQGFKRSKLNYHLLKNTSFPEAQGSDQPAWGVRNPPCSLVPPHFTFLLSGAPNSHFAEVPQVMNPMAPENTHMFFSHPFLEDICTVSGSCGVHGSHSSMP